MDRVIPTSCTRDCPDGCSLLVTVRDGEVVSQVGDPRNPYTRTFLCGKSKGYIDRYNSPNRLLTPMLRRGDDFVPISWDAAVDLIAEQLTRTRAESGPLSTLWTQYSGSLSLLNLFMSRVFWIHMGGSTVTTGGISIDSLQAAQMTDFGSCLLHDPTDLLHSKNIVIWGKNPAVTNVHLMPFIKEARTRGAKLTVVDPRYTETARVADRHIALRPGTDGYLAMAVAREVRRRQGDVPASVQQQASGWAGYLSLLEGQEDGELLRRADVSAKDVAHLASAFWTDRPCATYLGLGLSWWKQGGANSRLIDALALLSGNVGAAGGGANFFNMEFPFGTQLFREEMAKAKERGVAGVKPRRILLPLLAQEIENAKEPPLRTAWIAMFNPVATAPDSNHLKKALRKLDFVIVTEQFMTATARCADLVLPVTTYLEEDDVINAHGHSYVSPVNAAVPPRGEALSNLQIFQKVAERMGFGEALAGSPWDWIGRAWAPLAEQGIALEDVRKGPVRRPQAEVPYAEGVFNTADGKFQLITEYAGREEPGPGFTLLMVKTPAFLNSQLLPEEAAQGPVVRLNPRIMAELGVQEGERVVVRSRLDGIEATATASEHTRTDVVEMVPSQWANDAGGVSRLREAVLSDLGPTGAVNETRVTVHKVA
ncbi:MAG: molybdopterin-dependent oxidoreductase [Proteobacteria bacterium]|nr:molybdopterin-dependent oxidoreductase [Pseudomonadota bacterium]